MGDAIAAGMPSVYNGLHLRLEKDANYVRRVGGEEVCFGWVRVRVGVGLEHLTVAADRCAYVQLPPTDGLRSSAGSGQRILVLEYVLRNGGCLGQTERVQRNGGRNNVRAVVQQNTDQ